MFVLVRAVTYAALFIGFVLVYLPGRFLSWSGVPQPEFVGGPQIGGMLIGAIGAVLALWCLLAFAFIGKGTPAPFDPPRRSPAQHSFINRGPFWFLPGCFFWQRTSSSSRTRNQLYGALSAKNMKR